MDTDISPAIVDRFLVAASVPRTGAHVAGTLDAAESLRAAHPGLAASSVHAAAALGDDAALREHLASEPSRATAIGGPHGWPPLLYLAFSRYLRLDPSRGAGLERSAELLLAAGADANGGWWEDGPGSTWESAIYGAAGLAHHAGVTRLLLAYGADPNDDETPYHAPESYDNGALLALLQSGRLSADSLVMMLVRKSDVHDSHGTRLLLEHGADPDRMARWGRSALHHAVLRDNPLEQLTFLIDHGATPALPDSAGTSAVALAARRGRADLLAARRGRADLLALFASRGARAALAPLDALLAGCAMGDVDAARGGMEREPAIAEAFREVHGTVLGRFAGNGNARGVRTLLALGVPVDARDAVGDPYFEVAPASTALHVAAWRARHDVVRLLLERGADVRARDSAGRTPLALAVRACVDSHWRHRRAPDSVAAMRAAGASTEGIALPTGYAEIDALLSS